MYKIKTEDYMEYMSEEEFLRGNPKPKYGEYRPQPYMEPEEYPCLAKQVTVVHNSNGPDEIVFNYEYDYE